MNDKLIPMVVGPVDRLKLEVTSFSFEGLSAASHFPGEICFCSYDD